MPSLVGASPSQPLLSGSPGAQLPLPPSIPVGLPASLLKQRPDLAASVAQMKAANAQVGVAEGAFYPALSLTSNFGFASKHLRDIASGRQTTGDTTTLEDYSVLARLREEEE